MKAALYARVSDERQVENFSISAQINLLTDYCTKNNIEIYNTYIDEAQKGWREDRPALQKMLKESKNFDIVLVHKYDRFARKDELSQKLEAQLEKNNVQVLSITEPISDIESPGGFFHRRLISLLAEHQIRNLGYEIKKGKQERAKQGYYNGGRLLGYDIKGKQLVINKKEAKIVKKIYDLYLLHGYGINKIANYLNKNNIRTKLNCSFTSTRVSYILRNVQYSGKIINNGNIYLGNHEPIITQEQQDKAISMLESNNKNPGTGRSNYRSFNYSFYYLLDVVKCDCCGSNFLIRRNKISAYYVCKNGYRKNNNYKYCPNNVYHKTKELEKHVEALLKSFIKGDNVNYFVSDVETEINNATENRLELIEKKLERAKEAYLDGVFSLLEYKKEFKSYKEEKDLLISKLNRPIKYINPNIYKNKVKNIWKQFISEPDIATKRALLQKVISAIYINNEGETRIEINIDS